MNLKAIVIGTLGMLKLECDGEGEVVEKGGSAGRCAKRQMSTLPTSPGPLIDDRPQQRSHTGIELL